MPSEQHRCASTGVVAYRPWATIQQPDPNVRLLRGYQDGVLNYITAHPGITMVTVCVCVCVCVVCCVCVLCVLCVCAVCVCMCVCCVCVCVCV